MQGSILFTRAVKMGKLRMLKLYLRVYMCAFQLTEISLVPIP